MSKLIKYLIVDLKSGKWNWNPDIEHHSIAVPKMLNHLELRKNYLLDILVQNITKGMKDSVYNRDHQNFRLEVNNLREEINLHIYMLAEFGRKVFANLETERMPSPIMKLKKMDSPLGKKKVSISHMYERYDNEEIIARLDATEEELESVLDTLDKSLDVWTRLTHIYKQKDAPTILDDMRDIKTLLLQIKHGEVYSAFFEFDDATKGLLNQKVSVQVYLNQAYNKLFDLILRTLIRGVDHYRKSEESVIVEKAFSRMKELQIGEIDLKLLLYVKMLLDVEIIESSPEMCYKKIGEMHANIHQKLFEISGLNYLKMYFSKPTIILIDRTIEELEYIHEKIAEKDEPCNLTDDRKLIERNVSELEVYHKIVKELLLETEEGKTNFPLSSKIYSINSYLASKYYVLNVANLDKCLKILTQDYFINFIDSCEKLMLALRGELKEKVDVESHDLFKVGITTGKTSMIDSYTKAVEVILASLGTFMGNTLHSLVKEILQNMSQSELREKLKYTYEKIELALREFDQDSLSESEEYVTL